MEVDYIVNELTNELDCLNPFDKEIYITATELAFLFLNQPYITTAVLAHQYLCKKESLFRLTSFARGAPDFYENVGWEANIRKVIDATSSGSNAVTAVIINHSSKDLIGIKKDSEYIMIIVKMFREKGLDDDTIFDVFKGFIFMSMLIGESNNIRYKFKLNTFAKEDYLNSKKAPQNRKYHTIHISKILVPSCIVTGELFNSNFDMVCGSYLIKRGTQISVIPTEDIYSGHIPNGPMAAVYPFMKNLCSIHAFLPDTDYKFIEATMDHKDNSISINTYSIETNNKIHRLSLCIGYTLSEGFSKYFKTGTFMEYKDYVIKNITAILSNSQ